MKSLAGLLLIVRRSLRQHLVSTVVTVFSTALAIGLVMAIFNVHSQARAAFTAEGLGVDAVLGARGSEVQLVLNSVFHLETSPGNIPWSMYREMAEDPRVSMAIPYAVGDNYQGFRIVGTTTAIFHELEVRRGERLRVRPGGVIFDPDVREAVIGSEVHRLANLRLGSFFNPRHGLAPAPDPRQEIIHPEEYQVVGILEPTGTPLDRVILIPIEGIFRMDGHILRGTGEDFIPEAGQEIPDEHKEVSAVLLRFRTPQIGFQFGMQINRQGTRATLAYPVQRVMLEIFDKLGWAVRVLQAVAYLVVLVAAASILAAIYNTMHERRREFAILRALGARKRTVFSAIVLEAGAIAALGSLAGFLFYGGILAGAAYVVRQQTGVVLDPFAPHPVLWAAPLGMVLLGAAAGLAPAVKAYATAVVDNLQPTS